jgi:hypothetical protein
MWIGSNISATIFFSVHAPIAAANDGINDLVQIVENWTCVTGSVTNYSSGAAKPTIELSVERAAEVAGFRNLVAQSLGETITVVLPQALPESARALVGRKLTIPVRMAAPNRYFAASDWSLENGSSRCGPNPPTGSDTSN